MAKRIDFFVANPERKLLAQAFLCRDCANLPSGGNDIAMVLHERIAAHEHQIVDCDSDAHLAFCAFCGGVAVDTLDRGWGF